jgi:multidrug resistance efflux pump
MKPHQNSYYPELFFSLLMLLALLLISCKGEEKPTAQTPAPATLDPTQVVAIGRIEPEGQIVTLSAEVSGIVARLAAREGDTLRKGDLILEMSSDVEAAQLALAKARLATQRQQIAQAEANLQGARITAQNNQVKFRRIQNVYEQGAETGQNFDNARTDVQTAEQEVARLEAALNAARRQYAEFGDDIRVSEAQLAKKRLFAPADGLLLTLDVRKGNLLSPGTAVGDFAPAGPTIAVCEVDELFANDVRAGQPAAIRQQGTTRILAQGTVTYAAPALRKKSLFSDDPANLEDRRVREVKIRLTDGDSLLYNSRVECVIKVK